MSTLTIITESDSDKNIYIYTRIANLTYSDYPVYQQLLCNIGIHKATIPFISSHKYIYYILTDEKRKLEIDSYIANIHSLDNIYSLETAFTKLGTYIGCEPRYSSSYANCANDDNDYKVDVFQISNTVSTIKQEIHIDERALLYVIDIPDSNENMVYIPSGLYGGNKIFYKTY